MIDSGMPGPSTNSIRLLPFFSPIRGVWPDRFLRQWGFHHSPVAALPAPGDALHVVVLGQPRLPQGMEESRALRHPPLPQRNEKSRRPPFPEALVYRPGAAEALLG